MRGSYLVSWQIEGDILQIHDNLVFVCRHALICICGTFYIFADTAVDELKVCRVQFVDVTGYGCR